MNLFRLMCISVLFAACHTYGAAKSNITLDSIANQRRILTRELKALGDTFKPYSGADTTDRIWQIQKELEELDQQRTELMKTQPSAQEQLKQAQALLNQAAEQNQRYAAQGAVLMKNVESSFAQLKATAAANPRFAPQLAALEEDHQKAMAALANGEMPPFPPHMPFLELPSMPKCPAFPDFQGFPGIPFPFPSMLMQPSAPDAQSVEPTDPDTQSSEGDLQRELAAKMQEWQEMAEAANPE